MIRWRNFATLADACDAIAALAAEVLGDAVSQRGGAHLILSGGRTPASYLPRLAGTAVPWARVMLSLSDERCVPPDHPASNEGMVRRLLAEPTGAALTCLRAAEAVPAPLRALPWPADLSILGVGADGHVASLFPGQPWGEDDDWLVPAQCPDGHRRLSLSATRLRHCRRHTLVATGEAKRAVLERASAKDCRLPVSLLAAGNDPLEVFWTLG